MTITEPTITLSVDGFLSVPVAAVEHDTADSVIVTFDVSRIDPSVNLAFEHGQHLTLRRHFPSDGTDDRNGGDDGDTVSDHVEVRRSYSICSAAPDGTLRVAIRRVDGGVFSTFANTELAVGDLIDIAPPTGKFTHPLAPEAARRYLLVAGGSGITPVYSIAATVLADEPESTIDLWYVNRSAQSTMLLEELHDLRDRYLDRLCINFAFTREETASPLLSGRPDRSRVDALIDTGLLPTDVDAVFLCGPVELLDTVEDALVDHGVAADVIHREIFTAAQQGQVRLKPQALTSASVVVARGTAKLHDRTTSFELYEGDTVLEAVERVRADTPYSCRAGVCSTCQAKMPTGSVTMDVNHGLTPAEVERGYVLTCQSRPRDGVTDLHVDYDV